MSTAVFLPVVRVRAVEPAEQVPSVGLQGRRRPAQSPVNIVDCMLLLAQLAVTVVLMAVRLEQWGYKGRGGSPCPVAQEVAVLLRTMCLGTVEPTEDLG